MRRLLTANDVLDLIADIGHPWRLTLWDGVRHEHFLGELGANGYVEAEFGEHLHRAFCGGGHLVCRLPALQPSRLDSRGRVIVTPDRVEIITFRPAVRLTQQQVVLELGRFPEHIAPFRGAFRSETRYNPPLPAAVEATA